MTDNCLSVWLIFFIRHLSEEIRIEHSTRASAGTPVDDLFGLVTQIVPYFMSHNAETDACDLLMEVERLDILDGVVESVTYQRVCRYLTRYTNVFIIIIYQAENIII